MVQLVENVQRSNKLPTKCEAIDYYNFLKFYKDNFMGMSGQLE